MTTAALMNTIQQLQLRPQQASYDETATIRCLDIYAMNNKGALDNLGNYNRAIPYYDKALAIDPLENKRWALSFR